MNKRAIFSIVSCNYFHYAKTLMQSVKVVDSTSDLYVVIVDDGYDPALYASKTFHVINFLNCSATITLERQRQLHLCIFRGIVVC